MPHATRARRRGVGRRGAKPPAATASLYTTATRPRSPVPKPRLVGKICTPGPRTRPDPSSLYLPRLHDAPQPPRSRGPTLAFTTYSFTSRPWCTINQPSFQPPRPPALPPPWCNTGARQLGSIRLLSTTPRVYAIHHTILVIPISSPSPDSAYATRNSASSIASKSYAPPPPPPPRTG